jgi:hypothetical protein
VTQVATALVIAPLVLAAGWLLVAPATRREQPRRRRPPTWVREPPVSQAEADRRSLDLMRSVVNEDEWAMFTELGFLCVTGRRFRRDGREALPRYRYLVYPHLPLVALLPRSMAPVREYCIQFPDVALQGPDGQLPIGDDVLAKWMTVRADEDRLLAFANVSNAGCQIPLNQIERDLRRLARWQAAHQPHDAAGPAITARY